MNCDQVFDVLTRGPFPTGADSDIHVERHLLACHDCRQLAEALRPAVELLHECVDDAESDDLPGYRGWLDKGSLGVAEAVRRAASDQAVSDRAVSDRAVQSYTEDARSVSESQSRSLSGRTWSWLYVAASAAVIGWLLVPFGASDHDGPRRSAVDRDVAEAPDAGGRLTDSGRLMLTRLDLPRACRDESMLNEVAAISANNTRTAASPHAPANREYMCCTLCHASGVERTTSRATARAALSVTIRSCEACHVTANPSYSARNL